MSTIKRGKLQEIKEIVSDYGPPFLITVKSLLTNSPKIILVV